MDVLGVRCGGVRATGAGAGTLVLGSPRGLTTPFPPNAPGRPPQQLEGLTSPETSLLQARLQTE